MMLAASAPTTKMSRSFRAHASISVMLEAIQIYEVSTPDEG
jgi:hypothetical protein